MAAEMLGFEDLGHRVSLERKRRGMSLREAAVTTGVPFNTLARVERGHIPDLQKFKRLVEWCGLDVGAFFELQATTLSTTDLIAELLKSDRNLPNGAAEQITGIVVELYSALAQPREVSAVHLRSAKTFRMEAADVLGELLNDLYKALSEESEDGSKAGVQV